jgi:hypothetical protein
MDLGSLLPPRSIEDILAERVRLVIGGEVYDLPALVIEKNDEWKASLEADLTGMLAALDEAGNDVGSIVATLSQEPTRLLNLLRSYDATGVLPDDATIRASMTPIGILRAVLEVWRAANPLVDIAVAGMSLNEVMPKRSRRPTNVSRPNTAGRSAKSAAS